MADQKKKNSTSFKKGNTAAKGKAGKLHKKTVFNKMVDKIVADGKIKTAKDMRDLGAAIIFAAMTTGPEARRIAVTLKMKDNLFPRMYEEVGGDTKGKLIPVYMRPEDMVDHSKLVPADKKEEEK